MKHNLVSVLQEINQSYTHQIKNDSVKFTINTSGCRSLVQYMNIPAFRISVYVALLAIQTKQSYIIMVTASHNSASHNGLKIGRVNSSMIDKATYQLIEIGLNNTQQFLQYIQNKLCSIQTNKIASKVYLGRDCRDSSPKLMEIAYGTLQKLGIQCIDLGVCTTPELWTLSQQIERKKYELYPQNTISDIKNQFVSSILGIFGRTWQLIRGNSEKQQILFDFANGSGAISYQLYHHKLSEYFDITQINNRDFTRPNYQCGAAYFQKHWESTNTPIFNSQHICAFFDGDSDRILIKIKNNQQCFDGNYLAILLFKTLKKLLANLPKNIYDFLCETLSNQLQPVLVMNSHMNKGLEFQTSESQLFKSEVGIHNVFNKASKYDLSVFFQPNGHGGVYFSQQLQNSLEELTLKNPTNIELITLQSLSGIIKNNPRGYALHLFLVFLICRQYLYGQSYSQQIFKVYKEFKQIKLQIKVKQHLGAKFKNKQFGELANLEEPEEIVQKTMVLLDQYKGHYQVLLRKSQTQENLIRVSIQGEDASVCETISGRIKDIFIGYEK